MNAIRFMSAAALAATLAGCAGTTGLGPALTTGAVPQESRPVETVKAPVTPSVTPPVKQPVTTPEAAAPEVAALPRRVAAAPRYVPAPKAAPAPVYKRQEPTYTQQVTTVPVAEPKPAPAPEPRYVEAEPEPAPVYEPVETVAVPEPVAAPEPEPQPQRYTAIGVLDAPVPLPVPVVVAPVVAPVYEPVVAAAVPPAIRSRSRAMAPIRDEPADGRNGRQAAVDEVRVHARKAYRRNAALRAGGLKPKVRSNFTPAFGMELEQAALGRINPSIRYDARYVPIGYPWGDVDEATGVCSDVVIRSYRKLGIDLQKLVHEDMKRAFRAYPSKRIYGLKTVDANIDHRRVVNLEAFFERTGASIEIGTAPDDFIPGDVLTWRLSGNEPHIGIVVSDRDPRTGMPLVVHNLGAGVRKEDLISLSAPVGHFRFAPDRQTVVAALVTKQ